MTLKIGFFINKLVDNTDCASQSKNCGCDPRHPNPVSHSWGYPPLRARLHTIDD